MDEDDISGGGGGGGRKVAWEEKRAGGRERYGEAEARGTEKKRREGKEGKEKVLAGGVHYRDV